MSTKKPRSPQFKLKVVLAALSGKETISEICQRFEVAESLVHKWRKQLLEEGEQIFAKSSDKGTDKQLQAKNKEIEKLYNKVGRLTIERDFLKKNLGEN